jgi:hypothetical protein
MKHTTECFTRYTNHAEYHVAIPRPTRSFRLDSIHRCVPPIGTARFSIPRSAHIREVEGWGEAGLGQLTVMCSSSVSDGLMAWGFPEVYRPTSKWSPVLICSDRLCLRTHTLHRLLVVPKLYVPGPASELYQPCESSLSEVVFLWIATDCISVSSSQACARGDKRSN